LTSEDPGFDPAMISPSDIEKRRILEEESKSRQMDEKMCAEGEHRKENTAVVNTDPIPRRLDEIVGTITKLENQLYRIESKLDKLLASREIGQ
jgi:hypothetical protein